MQKTTPSHEGEVTLVEVIEKEVVVFIYVGLGTHSRSSSAEGKLTRRRSDFPHDGGGSDSDREKLRLVLPRTWEVVNWLVASLLNFDLHQFVTLAIEWLSLSFSFGLRDAAASTQLVVVVVSSSGRSPNRRPAPPMIEPGSETWDSGSEDSVVVDPVWNGVKKT